MIGQCKPIGGFFPDKERAVRGGSYLDIGNDFPAGERNGYFPGTDGIDMGSRLVLY